MILRLSLLGFLFGLAFRVFAQSPDYSGVLNGIYNELDDINGNTAHNLSELVAIYNQDSNFYDQLKTILSSSGASGTVGNEVYNLSLILRQFLLGSTSATWNSDMPQFRFLSALTGRPNPADSVSQQSLTYFLSYVLGQNVDWRIGLPQRTDWDLVFTTNSVYRNLNSASSSDYPGYSLFNVWLAEGVRRVLTNQLDFAARGGSWSNEESGAASSTEEGNNLATNVLPSDSVDLDRPASVGWFDFSVVDSPDWSLEGANLDPTVFDATVGGQRMVLKVPFSAGGGAWRLITSFMVYVATACVLVGIIRSEIDYWTTLGGSAT